MGIQITQKNMLDRGVCEISLNIFLKSHESNSQIMVLDQVKVNLIVEASRNVAYTMKYPFHTCFTYLEEI